MIRSPARSRAALERALRDIAQPIGRHPLLGADRAPSRVVPAAVLVPITNDERAEILLTVRHSALRSHPGQISFPGGRVDSADADVAATALRETWEEVGIDPAAVEVVGALPPYLTGTGYSVVPVVGWIPSHYQYRLARNEVEEAFHVPCQYLFETGTWETHEYETESGPRAYAEIRFGRYRIWGATAGMIARLRDRLSHYPAEIHPERCGR